MSCDWETVKNVVPGNSSTKPDQTGGNGKGVKQSEMFNYSVYSRLGNKYECERKPSKNDSPTVLNSKQELSHLQPTWSAMSCQ